MQRNSSNAEGERRLSPRVKLPLPVKVVFQGGEVMTGETVDVAPFGVRIRREGGHKNIGSVGDRVGIDFVPPGGLNGQLPVKSKVVRICSSQGELVFQMMDPPDFCMAPSLVGKHPELSQVKSHLMKLAACDLTVLVRGESGTGKNMAVEAIHRFSDRSDKPFLRVNCPSIPESLFESQLFGAEKGSFTGASSAKPGLFRIGDGGTLLLDEISSIPLFQQAKLLRVIEDKSFYPVGGNRPVHVDCRIIACTNEDMEKLVEEGKFREDLYYRLMEATVHIPPLRKRKSDIPLLADHFMRLHCGSYARDYRPLDESLVESLVNRPWRGNVRELEQSIKRLAVLGDFSPEHASGDGVVPTETDGDPQLEGSEPRSLEKVIQKTEESTIRQALDRSEGSKTKAASRLQVSYRTLQRKIRNFGLDMSADRGGGHSEGQCFQTAPAAVLSEKERSLEEICRAAESRAIARTLNRENGNLTKAAALLEVSYSTLLRKMKVHNLKI